MSHGASVDVMDRLIGLSAEIDALDAAVRENTHALENPGVNTKRFPMFESVAFVIPLDGTFATGAPSQQSFAPKEQFWNNASWDAYITEVSYSVYGAFKPSAAAAATEYVLLYDSEAGMYFGNTFPNSNVQRGVIFDFEWNYRLHTSGRTYVNGDAKFASRKSLGNKYTDQMLRFTDPLFVKAGDYMVWMLRPTLFSPGSRSVIPGGIANNSTARFGTIVVNFHINGYRDGTMAEAAYEQP